MQSQKTKIQTQALTTWENNGRRGTLAIATGAGKSKIFIDILKKDSNDYQALLAVPTEVLRDITWPQEFSKWGAQDILKSKVQIECHASIHTIKGKKIKYFCVDEAHKITPLFMEVFKNNEIEHVLFLTATTPKKFDKQKLINAVAPVVFEYSLDQAVADGVVSPYILNIVELYLDNTVRNHKVGTTPVTEVTVHKILQERIDKASNGSKTKQFAIFARNRFIYNLHSKTLLMQQLISKLAESKRTLVFAGSISQAEILCEHRYHSKAKKISKEHLELFLSKKINLLSCVDALNEGITVPDIDQAIISQVKSDSLYLVQRLGRTVRYRDDHRADIWILKAMYTADEQWVNNAISTIDPTNIKYHKASSLHLTL